MTQSKRPTPRASMPHHPGDDDGVFSSVSPDDKALYWLREASKKKSRANPSPPKTPALKPYLMVENTQGATVKEIEVTHSPFTIGGPHSDLPLKDSFVSNWHANIFVVNGILMIENMGGYNGTFLRIADELILEDHDEIIIGDQRIQFRTSFDGCEQQKLSQDNIVKLGTSVPEQVARLFFYYEGGKLAGVYPIGQSLTVGRSHSDVNIHNDESLSSPHICIDQRDGKYYIQDLHSELGTFIRVHNAVEIVEGDFFMVGRTRLRIAYK